MKTHIETPAYNACDPSTTQTVGFDANCSLVCYLGQAYISGLLEIDVYREECGSLEPVSTYLYNPSMFYCPVSCPANYDDTTPQNSTWVGSTIVTTSQGSGGGYGFRNKFDAILNAVRVPASGSYGVRDYIALNLKTSRLMPDSLLWSVCNEATMTLVETPASINSDGYFARYYESDLTQVSFNEDDCTKEVKWIRTRLSLLSYRFGCQIDGTPTSKKCNLRTYRDGFFREHSCLVCLVTPSTRYSWNPQVVQIGVNPDGCGIGNRCGCFEWDGIVLEPIDSDQNDLLYAGCPDETPSTNIQQIQYGFGGQNSSGQAYDILLKTINRTGPICVAARLAILPKPAWVIGTVSVIQDEAPFIMKADFSGLLPDNPVFIFYGYEWPNTIISGCTEEHENTGVLPFNLFDEDSDTFGILEKNGTYDVIGYNNFSLGNIIGYEPSLMMNTPPKLTINTPIPSKGVLGRYKLPCVNLGAELRKDSGCGCSGAGASIYECKIYGECKKITNKIDEKYAVCMKCDKYTTEGE